MPFMLISIFVFIIGTIFGSFLNVCIHRLPREESIVWPGSKCPACGKLIAWYDNIPVFSFLVLGGRCRSCKIKISSRYWIIEILTGCAYLWIWFYFGLTLVALAAAILFSLLLVAAVVDLEHQIIPDEVSLGGLAVGFLLSALIPALHREVIWWRSLIDSGIGLVAGGGIIYLTGTIGNLWLFWVRHLGVQMRRNLYWRKKLSRYRHMKDSMGGGDVKLLAMLGAFLGWQKVLLVFFLGPVLALPLGLFLKFIRKKEVIPFGPFLSLAGWFVFLWGNQIINWYLSGIGFID